jgi:hypothetical protein
MHGRSGYRVGVGRWKERRVDRDVQRPECVREGMKHGPCQPLKMVDWHGRLFH